MSKSYKIYTNDGAGGPLDLTTPLATTAGLTYTTAALAHPSEWTFLVRTLDTVTGFEDTNTDATASLILDASGVDVTNRPASPVGLSAIPTASGGLRIEWAWLAIPGEPVPTSFKIWCQATGGGPLNYALTPTGTASYARGVASFRLDIASLTDATTYTIGVRATNASGDETNIDTVDATADASGPLPVQSLTGTPTY